MILVELALLGLRGFPSLARLRFQPGLNTARIGAPEARRAVLDALYHTLFPDLSRGDATAGLADPQAPEARIALTFHGRDRVVYRMIREARNGATRLFRFDAASRQYHLFSDSSQEAVQYLRVQQQLPDEIAFERLFVFDPAARPSLGARAQTRSGAPLVREGYDAAPSAPGLPRAPAPGRGSGYGPSPVLQRASGYGPAPARSGVPNINNALVAAELEGDAPLEVASEQDRRALLTRLEQELVVARRAAEAQAELDRLSGEKQALTARGAGVLQLEASLAAAEAELAGQPELSELPPGFAERLRDYEALERRHQADIARAEEEVRALEEAERARAPLPVLRDPRFFAGVAGAVASAALAVGLERPLLALLNIPFALLAAGSGFRFIGELEEGARAGQRIGAARERVTRIEKQRSLDTGATRRLMDKLGIDDPAELAARIEAREAAKAQVETLRAALETARSDPETRGAGEALAALRSRTEALEALVVAHAGGASTESLERRVRSLRQELGASEQRLGVELASGLTGDLGRLTGDVGRIGASLERSGVPAPSRGRSEVRTASLPVSPGASPQPPAPRPADTRALFDFDGAQLGGEDDEEDGYGSGYGGGGGEGGDRGGGGSGLSAASAWGGDPRSGGGRGSSHDLGYPVPDRSRELVQGAVDLLHVPVDELVTSLGERCGQYLGALTGGEIGRVAFGPRGELSVGSAQGGELVPYVELEGARLDLADAALRLTLVEALVRRHPIPVLFDDPFGELPPRARKLFGQMLAYLGEATQVLVLTGAEDLPGQPVVG